MAYVYVKKWISMMTRKVYLSIKMNTTSGLRRQQLLRLKQCSLYLITTLFLLLCKLIFWHIQIPQILILIEKYVLIVGSFQNGSNWSICLYISNLTTLHIPSKAMCRCTYPAKLCVAAHTYQIHKKSVC